MAIVGYARVSTEEQHLDLQIFSLRAAGCERIFEDHGVSAIAKRRPGFEAMRAALSRNDVAVVWRIDRAWRDVRAALETVQEFERRGIVFRSIMEPHLDTSTPMGRAMFQIQNVFAELERQLISERTKAGLEAARRRGKVLGRRPLLSDADIAQVRRALNGGAPSLAQLAADLNVSPRTLRRALHQHGTCSST